MTFDHKSIDAKWQRIWQETGVYALEKNSSKPKKYILDMFPYPSGQGLHVGHPHGYVGTDVLSRFYRMQGFNVLHPMGWDSFGLPAENYAIKTGVHPEETTEKAILNFHSQIEHIGLSIDWSREIAAHRKEYYRWTQWLFLQLYKKGLAYKKKAAVNWDPIDQTVLANEQVLPDGTAERSGAKVIQKDLEQWFFKITEYADELITGLDQLDWPASTKQHQIHWIGRKEGVNISYDIEGKDFPITVFTTRPDTNFGATFIVVAPDSTFAKEYVDQFPEKSACVAYMEATSKKTELERLAEGKQKSGVFTGLYALNNLNGRRLPIYLGDFVLRNVGTGCVVGVPGHDVRDFEFAKALGIDIIRVVVSSDGDASPITDVSQVQEKEGTMINSQFLDGLPIMEAKEKITAYLEEKGWGQRVVNYKLRDWLLSRQRYWGAPIPIVYDPEGNAHMIPEEHLPWTLPTDVDYTPKGTPPLGSSKELQERTEKIFGPGWRPEYDTMDTFVCSSWYYFRFTDPTNTEAFASHEALENLLPVDIYVGGAEHTVLHLLYARFFTKALRDLGYLTFDEPFLKLRHQGMILAEDNRKMSKRWNNVINPDDVIAQYGADSFRTYELFMGPFESVKPWSTKSIEGVYRFMQKIWKLQEKVKKNVQESEEVTTLLHQTIKKVTEDIEGLHFNTAISQMMILANLLTDQSTVAQTTFETLLLLLAPFAPHITEELWSVLGHSESLQKHPWPPYDPALTIKSSIEIAVQVNGKLRGTITINKDASQEEVLGLAKQHESVAKHIEGQTLKKEIYIQGKIVNLVV